jgi:hypothetical protein
VLLLTVACARGIDPTSEPPTGTAGDDRGDGGSTRVDTSVTLPSPSGGSSSASVDGGAVQKQDAAGPHEAAPDAGGVSPTVSPLDPELSLPEGDAGKECTTPGTFVGCGATKLCRIATADGGRCEGCTTCYNEGESCTKSSDCSTLHQCYAGSCRLICRLGTQCPHSACLDVGHATHGICE